MANRQWEGRYVHALLREWEMRRHEVADPFTTIYIGGGTPSSLRDESLAAIIDALPRAGIEEFTIEANPEDVTSRRVESWRAMGINRVSMGVQSLNDDELRVIGRRHTAQGAIEAIEALRVGGIDNYSLDLIYGLPGQHMESWRDSLNRLLDCEPSHFSAYMLSYEPRTRLAMMLRRGEVAEASEELIGEMYALLCDTARQRGYEHYEISNFGLSGRHAVHNSNYWRNLPYLGLGPSAHSYDGQSRRANCANLKQYIELMERNEPAYEIEEETPDNQFNDMLMVSLRTSRGLDLAQVPSSRLAPLMRQARKWLSSGQLIERDSRLIIPEPHWLISDAIISDLFA